MIAKMPMTGSPEEGRDCIAQLPLRSLIFDTRVKLRHYADQLNFLFNLGRHTDSHGKRPSQRYLDYQRSRANLTLKKCWASSSPPSPGTAGRSSGKTSSQAGDCAPLQRTLKAKCPDGQESRAGEVT